MMNPSFFPQATTLVPGSFYAGLQNVVGDITPNSVSIGNQLVINEREGVGAPTGIAVSRSTR